MVDLFARHFGLGSIWTGLIFAATMGLGATVINLPFSIYSTFVIEERYGFNKTTVKTFVSDIIKSLILAVILGGLILAAILWFFEKTGPLAWVYCWFAVTVFEIFLLFIAPYVIMPLFNKFIPLEDGDLKTAVETYVKAQNFRMKGLFKMDGSKRSAKTNAFFTGFGKSRRIVLFDTLIAKHTVPELVSIVGHEMGHYKKKHIPAAIARAIATSGLMFCLLSFFIGNPGLFDAFRMQHVSIYASLFFFSFLYTPIAMVLGVIENWISRKHEYEADAYAVETAGNPGAMISSLKKLTVDNLSNLTPHPLKVVLSYSHPPVLDRIRAIRAATWSSQISKTIRRPRAGFSRHRKISSLPEHGRMPPRHPGRDASPPRTADGPARRLPSSRSAITGSYSTLWRPERHTGWRTSLQLTARN